MIEKFEIDSREIADEFLASMVASGKQPTDASFHASDKISDPLIRNYFLERARQVL